MRFPMTSKFFKFLLISLLLPIQKVTWCSLLQNCVAISVFVKSLLECKTTLWREQVIKRTEFHKGCYLASWFPFQSLFSTKSYVTKKISSSPVCFHSGSKHEHVRWRLHFQRSISAIHFSAHFQNIMNFVNLFFFLFFFKLWALKFLP